MEDPALGRDQAPNPESPESVSASLKAIVPADLSEISSAIAERDIPHAVFALRIRLEEKPQHHAIDPLTIKRFDRNERPVGAAMREPAPDETIDLASEIKRKLEPVANERQSFMRALHSGPPADSRSPKSLPRRARGAGDMQETS